MSRFTATITSSTIVMTERNSSNLTCSIVGEEPRPVNFAAADMALAAHGYQRVTGWDLSGADHITADIQAVDNLFNGVRAARFEQAIGTTHDEFRLTAANSVDNGDLITDRDYSQVYVIAGSSTESGSTTLHMVAEGHTWHQRHTSQFTGLVWIARKR
jgi:hypothetical protein